MRGLDAAPPRALNEADWAAVIGPVAALVEDGGGGEGPPPPRGPDIAVPSTDLADLFRATMQRTGSHNSSPASANPSARTAGFEWKVFPLMSRAGFEQ